MKTVIAIVFTILILFSGCSNRQISYNGDNTYTVKQGGMYYTIPRGMLFSSALLSYKASKQFNAFGLSCSKGDILWMSAKTKKNTSKHSKSYFKKAVRKKLIGCSHPQSKPRQAYKSKRRKYVCAELTKTQAYSLLRKGHTYLDRDSDGHPCEWGKKRSTSYYKSSYKSNCHYVRGYYRRSGTYVRGHTRCR